MKELQPPLIPTWLLQCFGVTARNEALTGDLIEEFGSGRSRLWYWTQAILAIFLTARADLWRHKLLALRALLVGEIASTVLSITLASMVQRWSPRFDIGSVNWWLYTISTVFIIYGVSGWLVGRFHRAHCAAMVLSFALMTLCLSICWNFSLLSIHFSNSIDSPRFRPYLAFDIFYLAVIWLATVIGGLVGARRVGTIRTEDSFPDGMSLL